MKWIIENWNAIVAIPLFASELLAAITQIVAPKNKGISGFLAAIIKFLQNIETKR